MAKAVKNKVLLLKGLPASGKSTYAKKLAEEGWVRTNKDTIRLDTRLFPTGYNFKNKKHEKQVVKERNRQIEAALSEGKNVVVDDTNLSPVHTRKVMLLAQKYDADFEIKDDFLKVPLSELIERDKNRENSVGENVIRRMFHESVKTLPTFVQFNPALPTCVISDIDGTLTLGPKNRSPYEWHKVGNDDLNRATAYVLDGINVMNYAKEYGEESVFDRMGSKKNNVKVFLFSGRDEVCRTETEEWLERNCVQYDELFMRPTDRVDEKGNQVSDVIIKRELFNEHIRNKYNVLFIMDDRKQVCDMWRDELGLTVMQLGDPNWSF